MSVVILHYNAGNVCSVVNALERIGARLKITRSIEDLQSAERVIVPGVGQALSAMRFLREHRLEEVLLGLKVPVLGICLGLQLMCQFSEEGDAACLGILSEQVRRFSVPRKVPHMGWSRVNSLIHPIFEGIQEGSFFYFVHSYRVDVGSETIARCTYDETFAAAAARDNFVGVQFHPEKSAEAGERVLRNFLRWRA
jgi:glutamine amidotransferase